ncbi:hypothetical protein D8X55_03610 [Malacoplasma penetrans]|uniref:Transmembrane protein n=1 Tax=Malacoplasma penetrans (strain HF-2) TaxID=272633 RepID=Q8EUV8_MALP2|nr:hypothetical protein [Malacoplasma penetrans]RXY96466.1 hypothetical protein D8X55_03610 [Malacoplasma penetrans]BAC44603.1 hypothetical protein [Malacoplasma penetrans HF-2]
MIDLSNKALERKDDSVRRKTENQKSKNLTTKRIENTATRRIEIKKSPINKKEFTSNFVYSRRFPIFIVSSVLFLLSFGLIIFATTSIPQENHLNNLIFFSIITAINLIICIVLGIDLFRLIPNHDLNMDDEDDRSNYTYVRIFCLTKFIAASFALVVLLSITISLGLLNSQLSSLHLTNKTIYYSAAILSMIFNFVSVFTNILSFVESKFSRGILNE